MSISLPDLQLLLDVAERGGFSQAAALRGWSQPQVSQRVALLEASLGVSLFHRHRRGASPTAGALDYLAAVKKALQELEQAKLAIQGSPLLPVARIGCPPSLAGLVFAPLLGSLAQAPLELHCHVDHSPELMERLLSGRLKLAFVLNRASISGLNLELLIRSPIIAVAAPHHPLAQGQQLGMADLVEHRLAPQWWGSEAEALISKLRSLQAADCALPICQPASTARDLAQTHGFIAFAPAITLLPELQSGTLRHLPICDLPSWRWDVMLAYRSGKRPDPAREQLLQAARAIGKNWLAAHQVCGL